MPIITQEQINAVLWQACDTFRGKVDSSIYKDYVLVMLFVKYLSDTYKEKLAVYTRHHNGDRERIRLALSRERFILNEYSTFDYLYNKRNDPAIGKIINKALEHLEKENEGKLKGVFRKIDFDSETVLGAKKERNAMLKTLLEDFARLDLRPSVLEDEDIIGNAYQYMIKLFACDAGKKGGEFFTPPEVSEVLARLVKPRENDRIYDPACGSGSLLIRVVRQVPGRKAAVYGQERNGQTHALALMNMYLHGIDDARIAWGDTLANPLHLENGQLMKFQVIVANPPFSLDKWAMGFAGEGSGTEKFTMAANLDPYGRFAWGVPPSSKGDYAFVLHIIHSLAAGGRAAVILPRGVLFRGASEGKIRREIIKHNLLDAVIGLPENLFYGTSIPACVLVFKKNRGRKEILFIDASGEGNYEKGKNQNRLREQDIQKIVEIYERYETVDRYSYVASAEEIAANNYNLNLARYVDALPAEEPVDLAAVKEQLDRIRRELAEVERQMERYLAELGL